MLQRENRMILSALTVQNDRRAEKKRNVKWHLSRHDFRDWTDIAETRRSIRCVSSRSALPRASACVSKSLECPSRVKRKAILASCKRRAASTRRRAITLVPRECTKMFSTFHRRRTSQFMKKIIYKQIKAKMFSYSSH